MASRGPNTAITSLVLVAILIGILYLFLGLMGDQDIKRVFTILISTGAFGGLIFGFFQRQGRFDLPYFDSPARVYFGSLADCLIGVAASHAVFFVLAGSVNISGNNLENTLRLVALGLLSGMAGKSLLSNLQSRLVKQIDELGEKVEHTERKADKKYYYNLGVTYRLQTKWESAKWAFKEALRIDPDYTSAYLGLAEVFRDEYKSGPKTSDQSDLMKQALTNCNLAIQKEPDFAPAYLTRATVYALLDSEKEKARSDILKAIKLSPEMKQFISEELTWVKDQDWFVEATR